jgi:hypothetical protein
MAGKENPVETTTIVQNFVLFLVKHVLWKKIKMKKNDKKWKTKTKSKKKSTGKIVRFFFLIKIREKSTRKNKKRCGLEKVREISTGKKILEKSTKKKNTGKKPGKKSSGHVPDVPSVHVTSGNVTSGQACAIVRSSESSANATLSLLIYYFPLFKRCPFTEQFKLLWLYWSHISNWTWEYRILWKQLDLLHIFRHSPGNWHVYVAKIPWSP